jgi:glutathione S-transferase
MMQLIIGNKNYSSWSLRAWLLMQHFGLSFEELHIGLNETDTLNQLQTHCPNLKVPVLVDRGLRICDSLAICEYINEQYLESKALPSDVKQRAIMRAVCAEMHAGFLAMRAEMPMNCRRNVGRIDLSEAAKKDIARIIQLLGDSLEANAATGPYLFGKLSIADAFYIPILSRFNSYDIATPERVNNYQNIMLSLPAYRQWLADSMAEIAVITEAEV